MRPTCPQCRKALNVVGPRIDGPDRVRYYGCECGYRADAVRVPLEHAPPRAIAMNSKSRSDGLAKIL
jgi:C4-type Zn-finger protein